MKYIRRALERKIVSYLRQFPVVVITGPRQSGKSTLLQHLFGGKKSWNYFTFDERGTLMRALDDPDMFVNDIRSHTIIDEAQKAPELFHSIKYLVDKHSPYKIILSGSANFHLLSSVTETLAGRAGILELLPFSLDELFRKSGSTGMLHRIMNAPGIESLLDAKGVLPIKEDALMQYILFGGYPRIQTYKGSPQKITWLENYRTTYIERDLRELTQVADINLFQRFYQVLAFQTGNILNLSNIAGDLGVSVATCKKYLRILEASYQYFVLNPYHANLKKRLVKTPKIFVSDTGMANFFLENSTKKMMLYSGRFGHLFENFVISEFLKTNTQQTRKRHFYYWRTSGGSEVDLLIDKGTQIIPVEIKSSVKITNLSIKGLINFISLDIGKKIPFGIVIYRGQEIYRVHKKILAIPVSLI